MLDLLTDYSGTPIFRSTLDVMGMILPYSYGTYTGDGSADDTAAIQAMFDANTAGGNFFLPGTAKLGTFTWPSTSQFNVYTTGMVLTDTYPLEGSKSLIGVGGDTGAQFAIAPQATITPPASTSPAILVTGTSNHYLANLYIKNPQGPGIEASGEQASGGALLLMNNVSCTCGNNFATAIPLLVKTFFWIFIKKCQFIQAHTNYGYCADFNTNITTDQPYTGLVFMDECMIAGQGMRIKNISTSLSPVFRFNRITYESGNNDFLELAGDGKISDVQIETPEIADSVSTVYALYINTPAAQAVRLDYINNNQGMLNPLSQSVNGLVINGDSRFDYSTGIQAIIPSYTQNFFRRLGGCLDAKLVRPQNISPVQYAPLAVEQDAANWTGSFGATITTGVMAPDGTTTAATVGGTNGGLVYVYSSNASTPTTNDWFIIGCWLRAVDTASPPSYVQFSINDAGYSINDSANNYLIVGITDQFSRINDGAWKFVSGAAKITSVGAATPTISLMLPMDTAYNSTSFWMPNLIHIPASAGVPDADVMQWMRNMQSIPSTSDAGDITILPHQKLRIGGGTRLFSASAAPTSGAWSVGDKCFNSSPSTGNPKGWVCTVAGSPGTWVSEGNL